LLFTLLSVDAHTVMAAIRTTHRGKPFTQVTAFKGMPGQFKGHNIWEKER